MLDTMQGRSGRRDPSRVKGRVLDDVALGEVRGLLGSRPCRRDLLIEFLHPVQGAFSDSGLRGAGFFTHGSCRRCTPCRAGTEKMVRLLHRDRLEEEVVRDPEQIMHDASICGLGQTVPNPVNHLPTHFREDL